MGYVPRAVSVMWGTCQDAQLWAEVYKGRRRWQVCTSLQEVCPWWGRWILPKFKGKFFKYYPWLRYNLITTVLNVCYSAYMWHNTEWCLTLLTFRFLLWKVRECILKATSSVFNIDKMLRNWELSFHWCYPRWSWNPHCWRKKLS